MEHFFFQNETSSFRVKAV